MSKILTAQMHAWLQVFACAARHLSFTRCADELHVTPGAISQQMKQLEDRLGFALFHRVGRGLELTAQGQRLALVANEVHGRIDDELRLLHSGAIGGIFKLRCIPSFLAKWLMPRLPAEWPRCAWPSYEGWRNRSPSRTAPSTPSTPRVVTRR